MPSSFLNSLLLSVPLLITPLFAAAQSNANTNYSFSSAQVCTLDDAGQVSCVLAQGYERLRPPSNLPALEAVTTGEAHACGLTADGQAVCWGDNFFGQLNVPEDTGSLVQIDAGSNHTCALDSNLEAICWGLGENLQLEPPEGATFIQVDAADILSCGLLTDGEVACWTDNPSRTPSSLSGAFVKIDLRPGAVCGLAEDGQIQCASTTSTGVAMDPGAPENGPYIDFAASRSAVCGLQADGSLDCTFRNAEDASEYPLGERFASIKSNETDILLSTRAFINGSSTFVTSGTAMCGERMDGTLQCWDESAIFPGPDGENDSSNSNAELVASLELDLDARIYGENAVEIFWSPLPFNSVGTNPILQPEVEIFRNGESIAIQRSRFSFFDTSALARADYQIRLIDSEGNPGPVSGILDVNTNDGTVLFNGEPTLTRSELEDLPDVFTNTTAGSLSVGIVIAWDVNPDIEAMIDGYEIRVNGASAGFTRSQLFVDTVTSATGRCVEIIAVGFDETRLGVRAFGSGCN